MDHKRFLKYFLTTEPLLKGYIFSCIGNRPEADDVLQQISTVLWEKFDQFDENCSFRAWAMGIARLSILKHRQKYARSREYLSGDVIKLMSETCEETAGEASDHMTHLRICLKGLKKTMKELIQLRYYQNRTIKEISTELHKKVNTVEMALIRLRRSLRKCVERRVRAERPAT